MKKGGVIKKLGFVLVLLAFLGANANAGTTSCYTSCYGNSCSTTCYSY